MHRFTVDYSKDRPDPRVLINRGLFAHGLPRLILLCRTLGHQPIVDGYNSQYGPEEQSRHRWVVCGRCGIRPEPQGDLDPDEWDLGQAYTGALSPAKPVPDTVAKQLARRGIKPPRGPLPGAWPANPTSAVGAQVILGRANFVSAGFKVGSCTSEQCLAANISLGPVGAIYVHTEDHGRFIQRLLNGNPNLSTESREIGVSFWHGRLEWKLWAKRDSSSRDDPWWMRGSVHVDPRHYLLGKHTCDVTKLSEKTTATVPMPDGTTYEIQLRLERWVFGRLRGKKTTRYDVQWDCRQGIPVRFDRDIHGATVTVSEDGVENGQWVQEAVSAVAASCSRDRARYNYTAPEAA